MSYSDLLAELQKAHNDLLLKRNKYRLKVLRVQKIARALEIDVQSPHPDEEVQSTRESLLHFCNVILPEKLELIQAMDEFIVRVRSAQKLATVKGGTQMSVEFSQKMLQIVEELQKDHAVEEVDMDDIVKSVTKVYKLLQEAEE